MEETGPNISAIEFNVMPNISSTVDFISLEMPTESAYSGSLHEHLSAIGINDHSIAFPHSVSQNSLKTTLEKRKRKANLLSSQPRTANTSPVPTQPANQISPSNPRRFQRSISVVSSEKDLRHTLAVQFKNMRTLSAEDVSKSRKISNNSTTTLRNAITGGLVNTASVECMLVEEEDGTDSVSENVFPSPMSNSQDVPTSLGGVSLIIEADVQVMDKAIQKTIAHHSPDAVVAAAEKNSTSHTDSDIREGNEFNIKKGGIKKTFFQYTGHYLHLALATPSIVRIPHLAHKYASENGSAFFFSYVSCLLLLAAPICLLEITMAQYSSLGPVNIYVRCLPILKGVSYAMVATSGILMLLSSTWLTWAMFYLIESLHYELPWIHCPSNSTPGCHELNVENKVEQAVNSSLIPSDYYFQMTVTKSLQVETGDPMSFNVNLLPIQVLVWVLLFAFSSRHDAWSHRYLAWISAVFASTVLLVLMVSGLALSNSGRGLRQVFNIDFVNLKTDLDDPELWLDSLGQAFWSLGPTIGVLIARSSFQNFHHKIGREVLISVLMNLALHVVLTVLVFSYAGHLGLENVINKNEGFFFVISSYAMTMEGAPNFGSVIFFTCVCKCLLSHCLILVDTVATSLSDSLPISWRDGWRRILIDFLICVFGLLFSLPFVTKEGIYVMTTTDTLVPWVCGTVLGLLEVVALAYIYRTFRIQEHYIKMQKSKTSLELIWKFFIPIVLTGLLIWTAIVGIENPISWIYENTNRENWYFIFGIMMSLVPLITATLVLSMQLIKNRKNLQSLLHPSLHWGTALSRHRHLYLMNTTQVMGNRPWLVVQACEKEKFLPDQIQTWIPWGYTWVPDNSEEILVKEGNSNITPALRKQLANLLKNRFSSISKEPLMHRNFDQGQGFQSPEYVIEDTEDKLSVRERKSYENLND